MDWSIHRYQLQTLQSQRLYLASCLLVALLGIVASSILAYCGWTRQKTVLVFPYTDAPNLWISEQQLSPEYMKQLSYFWLGLRFTIQPNNVKSQQALLAQYVDPVTWDNWKAALQQEAEQVLHQEFRFVFYPQQAVLRDQTVHIQGTLHAWTRTVPLPPKQLALQLRWSVHQGMPRLVELREETLTTEDGRST